MKTLSFFKGLSVILLVMNLALISFFIWRKPPPPNRPPGKRNFIHQAQRMLKLDDQQSIQFEQMAQQHKTTLDSINEAQTQILKPWFQRVLEPSSESDHNDDLNQLGLLEQQKIEVTYQHFEEIKSLLKPDQMPEFESFMNEALKNILLKSKKKPRPPKDF